MHQKTRTFALACIVFGGFAFAPVDAAEREQVRAVINLIAAVKMPYPEKLDSNLSRTEWVRLDTRMAQPSRACASTTNKDGATSTLRR